MDQFIQQVAIPCLKSNKIDEATLSSLHNVISTQKTLSTETDYSFDEINLFRLFPGLENAMQRKLTEKWERLVAKFEQDGLNREFTKLISFRSKNYSPHELLSDWEILYAEDIVQLQTFHARNAFKRRNLVRKLQKLNLEKISVELLDEISREWSIPIRIADSTSNYIEFLRYLEMRVSSS
jgi:hypothetical protein